MPAAMKDTMLQLQFCKPEKQAEDPATLPQNSTSEILLIVTNFGQTKIRWNLQVTISSKGGRDIVAMPDNTSPPHQNPQDKPQDLMVKPVDTNTLLAPVPPEAPDIQGLLMQILTAQQQMVTKPLAYQ